MPLLISYALVNRETMMDLEEGRRLVGNMLEHGLDIYSITWGYPSRLDRYRTLDDYIDIYLNDCVDFIRRERGLDQINLMGVCQGGTFSAIYAALYPEKIRNLVTMVTPVDFDTEDGLLNIWSRYLDMDLMVDALGNIPGDFMNLGFLMLKPFQLMMDKYIGLVEDCAENPASSRTSCASKSGSSTARTRPLVRSPEDACAAVGRFYRVYHSQRRVGDRLVLRLEHELPAGFLAQVAGEHADAIAEGGLVASGPLPEEQDEPVDALRPRVVFAARFDRPTAIHRLISRLNDA